MKWKIFLSSIALTLLLVIFDKIIFEIPLYIITIPLIIGTAIISISSILQIGIVVLVWILFYILINYYII